MTTLFISDLHLHPSRPAVSERFIDFAAGLGPEVRALYILGDLFESWVGDDHPEPAYTPVKQALRSCTSAGIPVLLMHGNRDFLIGERFAAETGCVLLDDPALIKLEDGRAALLMHGDSLCTDDRDYQALRARVREPSWQQQVLAMPLERRLQLAREWRELSALSVQDKPDSLMDVNPGEVLRVFQRYRVDLLIHGHTHRPGIHHLEHRGRQLQRVVLGDWSAQGSLLRVDGGRLRLTELSG